ncbi:hypothetical protein WMY93_023572 [Mugilogobius chulae]|uniref:Uncharacterized protein n=1 Tax=Mugilogobius chulae TaxID=88201 RepID=A0AAW0NH04_9GOBI
MAVRSGPVGEQRCPEAGLSGSCGRLCLNLKLMWGDPSQLSVSQPGVRGSLGVCQLKESVAGRLLPGDKAKPETQATKFVDDAFRATLAYETPGALPLMKQPGSDGFTLSSSPLFQDNDLTVRLRANPMTDPDFRHDMGVWSRVVQGEQGEGCLQAQLWHLQAHNQESIVLNQGGGEGHDKDAPRFVPLQDKHLGYFRLCSSQSSRSSGEEHKRKKKREKKTGAPP